MAIARHTGGYRIARGSGAGVLFFPDAGVAVPTVVAVGEVMVDGGLLFANFNIPEPTEGYDWYYGLRSQPKRPTSTSVGEAGGVRELDLGPADAAQEDCLFFLRRQTPRNHSAVQVVPLAYPAVDGTRPEVIGDLPDLALDVGDVLSVDCSDAFFGASIVYTAQLDGDNLPAEWAINASSGELTGPTTAALSATITVFATNAYGQVSSSFAVVISDGVLTVVTPAAFSGATPAVGVTWTVAAPTMSGDGGVYEIMYRPLRNGVAIGAGTYTTTTTYTFVAADQGTAVTMEYQVVGATETEVYVATGTAAVPASPGTNPSVVGTIANVVATPGATITRTAAGVFTGTGTPEYSMRFNTGPLIAGYAIDATTGVITLPNTADTAQRTLIVRAQYGALFAETSFTHEVRPALTVTGATFTPSVAPGTAVNSIWNVAGWAAGNATLPVTFTQRYRRDGTAFTNYINAPAYAIANVDRGTTITAEVRAQDSSNPVQTATMIATGSAVIPAAPGTETPDFTVNNSAELIAAMVTAAGRTTPQLIIANPGNYTKITRTVALIKQGFTLDNDEKRVNENNKVTVRALNPSIGAGAKSIFQCTGQQHPEFTRLSGFKFDGFVFRCTGKDGVNYPADPRQNSKVGGVAGFPGVNERWGEFAQCDNLEFVNCSCVGAHRGLSFTGGAACYRITVHYNDFLDFGLDGSPFFGDGFANIKINFNRYRYDVDYVRSSSNNPNRHPDSASIQGHSGKDLEVIGNSVFGGPGYAQGPFVPNGPVRNGEITWAAGRQERVTIRLNFTELGHTNSIVIGNAIDVDVSDNVVRRRLVLAGEVAAANYSMANLWISGDVRGFVGRNVVVGQVGFREGANANNKTGLNTNVISPVAWPAAMNGAPLPCGPYAQD